jgi:hypothetical protein
MPSAITLKGTAMTIYGQNNLASVIVPVEGFGGCGEPHSRPVVNGAPAKLWELSCDACENHLRHSEQWSVTVVELPETYDETKSREQSEKAGKMDRERQLAVALEQLAPLGQLPAALGQLLGQITGQTVPGALAGLMECPSGHPNAAGLKFCGECGQPMSAPVPAAAISAAPEATAPPAPAPAGQKQRRIRDARLEELQALAVAHKLDPVGNRSDLIVKLSNAGVTNNDLARLSVAA